MRKPGYICDSLPMNLGPKGEKRKRFTWHTASSAPEMGYISLLLLREHQQENIPSYPQYWCERWLTNFKKHNPNRWAASMAGMFGLHYAEDFSLSGTIHQASHGEADTQDEYIKTDSALDLWSAAMFTIIGDKPFSFFWDTLNSSPFYRGRWIEDVEPILRETPGTEKFLAALKARKHNQPISEHLAEPPIKRHRTRPFRFGFDKMKVGDYLGLRVSLWASEAPNPAKSFLASVVASCNHWAKINKPQTFTAELVDDETFVEVTRTF